VDPDGFHGVTLNLARDDAGDNAPGALGFLSLKSDYEKSFLAVSAIRLPW
jgi:hypothetical protein